MAGMPNPVETSTSTGGAAEFFRFTEKFLNDPEPPATRQGNRAAAYGSVQQFANIHAPTLEGSDADGGLVHFNAHWRGGPSGWWPNISAARVNSQMGSAFASALDPKFYDLDIRLRWDCSNRNINAVDAFWVNIATTPTEVWINITSPRAPGRTDPSSGLPNYGFKAISDLAPASLGPFTALGDQEVANYDGTVGSDTSFDDSSGETITTDGIRESWSFLPLAAPVENGPQVLTGLSYTRDSWRLVSDAPGTFEDTPLHSETGYLLWDSANGLAYRLIAMPRGLAVLAVARDVTAASTDLQFEADATGILTNPVLSQALTTARFTSTMRIPTDGASFSYDDTSEQLRAGSKDTFLHTDSNTLNRI